MTQITNNIPITDIKTEDDIHKKVIYGVFTNCSPNTASQYNIKVNTLDNMIGECNVSNTLSVNNILNYFIWWNEYIKKYWNIFITSVENLKLIILKIRWWYW